MPSSLCVCVCVCVCLKETPWRSVAHSIPYSRHVTMYLLRIRTSSSMTTMPLSHSRNVRMTQQYLTCRLCSDFPSFPKNVLYCLFLCLFFFSFSFFLFKSVRSLQESHWLSVSGLSVNLDWSSCFSAAFLSDIDGLKSLGCFVKGSFETAHRDEKIAGFTKPYFLAFVFTSPVRSLEEISE